MFGFPFDDVVMDGVFWTSAIMTEDELDEANEPWEEEEDII